MFKKKSLLFIFLSFFSMNVFGSSEEDIIEKGIEKNISNQNNNIIENKDIEEEFKIKVKMTINHLREKNKIDAIKEDEVATREKELISVFKNFEKIMNHEEACQIIFFYSLQNFQERANLLKTLYLRILDIESYDAKKSFLNHLAKAIHLLPRENFGEYSAVILKFNEQYPTKISRAKYEYIDKRLIKNGEDTSWHLIYFIEQISQFSIDNLKNYDYFSRYLTNEEVNEHRMKFALYLLNLIPQDYFLEFSEIMENILNQKQTYHVEQVPTKDKVSLDTPSLAELKDTLKDSIGYFGLTQLICLIGVKHYRISDNEELNRLKENLQKNDKFIQEKINDLLMKKEAYKIKRKILLIINRNIVDMIKNELFNRNDDLEKKFFDELEPIEGNRTQREFKCIGPSSVIEGEFKLRLKFEPGCLCRICKNSKELHNNPSIIHRLSEELKSNNPIRAYMFAELLMPVVQRTSELGQLIIQTFERLKEKGIERYSA